MNEIMQKTITAEELLKWQTHWVKCDLWNLRDSMDKDRYNGKTVSENIQANTARLSKIRLHLMRVIQEATHIFLDDGYTSEIEEAIAGYEWYQELLNEFDVVKRRLKTIYQDEESMKTGKFLDMIDEI